MTALAASDVLAALDFHHDVPCDCFYGTDKCQHSAQWRLRVLCETSADTCTVLACTDHLGEITRRRSTCTNHPASTVQLIRCEPLR